MKICFKCSLEKSLDDFYKHKKMADGHLNKCISCTKQDTRNTELKIRSTPEGLERDRKRHRDKYQKLGYKEKQKEWDKFKPWKQSQAYKNLSRDLEIPLGMEAHHWNYNDEYLKDVFILDRKIHRNIHRFLTLDLDRKIFMDLNGNYLDTKEKHKKFIECTPQPTK
jgi:hypothetical protein